MCVRPVLDLKSSLSNALYESVKSLFKEEIVLSYDYEINDNGFYHDFSLPRSLVPSDLPPLEEKMRDYLKEKSLSLDPQSFKLYAISAAHSKVDDKSLQRIHVYAFSSKFFLDQFLLNLSLLKKNDHRILGKELKMFFFDESAPGMAYWLPNGLFVLNKLISYWREVHEEEGYNEISSPLINSKKIWEISGHWEHYKDNMFLVEQDNEVYGLKPMNCPNAMVVFNHENKSYRDLPLRLSDCDALHRKEASGALHGLMRVQKFQQDDAHIFIENESIAIEKEFDRILSLVDKFYKIFNLDYSFRLASRPKDFIGEVSDWDRAEESLERVLKKHAPDGYELAKEDGAFYGPKIDILIKDKMGREWQMGSIQLDFQLPKRFNCLYADKDNSKKRPVVIHRVIYGSLERFIGILLEHSEGKLPFWLAPVQVKILPLSDKHIEYAEKVAEELRKNKIRVKVDSESKNLKVKIKNFYEEKVHYAIVIGDSEVESEVLSIMSGKEGKDKMKLDDIVKKFKRIVEEKG